MRALRAAWIRGGTSKGLFFRKQDLPPFGAARDALLLGAVGSPDASGLQLNGVGGGISSTSKVAVISKSERKDFDIDYLFGQVEIKDRYINWEGSCGNLSAAAGVFALAEGFVQPRFQEGRHAVRIWQVNQGYGMVVHVPSGIDAPLHEDAAPADSDGALISLAGVPGREPPIYVQLMDPTGGKALLPTGNVVDALQLPDGELVEATLVTAGNPTVFVPTAAAGLAGTELPSEMDYSKILPLVDHLRAQAAPLLGVELSDQPRVAFLSGPQNYTSSSGETITADTTHLLSRISTPGRIHHAHTGTGSIALASAACIEGSVAWKCIPASRRPSAGEALCFGHPGGMTEVRADVRWSKEQGWHAAGAGFERTARYLMRGEVFAPLADRAP